MTALKFNIITSNAMVLFLNKFSLMIRIIKGFLLNSTKINYYKSTAFSLSMTKIRTKKFIHKILCHFIKFNTHHLNTITKFWRRF